MDPSQAAPSQIPVHLIPSNTKVLAALAAGIATFALILGFTSFSDGFLGNVLAELAGVAVGVAVALALVDQVVRRERDRQWERVGLETKRAIKRRIWDVAFVFWLECQRPLPIEDDDFIARVTSDQTENEISQTITELAAAMRAILPARSAPEPPGIDPAYRFTESAHALHDSVADSFAYIKTTLTPRVLAIGADPTLVTGMLRLEEHEEAWGTWSKAGKRWDASSRVGWEQATTTLEIAATLYASLVEPGRQALTAGADFGPPRVQ